MWQTGEIYYTRVIVFRIFDYFGYYIVWLLIGSIVAGAFTSRFRNGNLLKGNQRTPLHICASRMNIKGISYMEATPVGVFECPRC